jgi:hypothetical protein
MKIKEIIEEINRSCEICEECDPCCTGNLLKKCIENNRLYSVTNNEIAKAERADIAKECKI